MSISMQDSHPVIHCSRDFEFSGHHFSIITEGSRDEVRSGNFSCAVTWLPSDDPQRPGDLKEPLPILILQFDKGEFDKGEAWFSHPEGLTVDHGKLGAFAALAHSDWDTFVGVPPDDVKDYLRDIVEQNWSVFEKQILTHAAPVIHAHAERHPHHSYMYYL